MPARPHSEKPLPNCPWKFQSCNQPFHQQQAAHRCLTAAQALKMDLQQLGSQHLPLAPLPGQIHCFCKVLHLLTSPLVEKRGKMYNNLDLDVRKRDYLVSWALALWFKWLNHSWLDYECVWAMFPSYHKRAPPKRKHEKQWITEKLLSFRLLLNPLCMFSALESVWSRTFWEWSYDDSRFPDVLRTFPTSQNKFWTSLKSDKY